MIRRWKAGFAAAASLAIGGAVAAWAFTPYISLTTLTGNDLLLTGPQNSTPVWIYDGLLAAGHLPPQTGAAKPALTSCGTSPAIVGTDGAGTVTMGTGTPTGCVITFATAYKAAPNCTVTWQATPLAAQSYALSMTAITLTQTATSSNVVNYRCSPQIGG